MQSTLQGAQTLATEVECVRRVEGGLALRVFLSYTHADKEFAHHLAKELSKKRYKVWYPDQDLLPGDNWSLEIGKALKESDAMIVLLSPESARSEWQQREIEYALASPNYEGRVIPVFVRPTAKFPWILERFSPIRASKSLTETSKRIVHQLRKTG